MKANVAEAEIEDLNEKITKAESMNAVCNTRISDLENELA